ncbi:MAG: hypothetical protein ACR2PW_04645 [Gammaproteobacteria bacterium]
MTDVDWLTDLKERDSRVRAEAIRMREEARTRRAALERERLSPRNEKQLLSQRFRNIAGFLRAARIDREMGLTHSRNIADGELALEDFKAALKE